MTYDKRTSVDEIAGREIFEPSCHFTWEVEKNGGVVITGYRKENADCEFSTEDYAGLPQQLQDLPVNVVIPEKINGRLVVAIGANAFKGCGTLTTIVFPSSLKRIGYEAFYGCVSLTKITFSRGLQTIGVCSFAWCKSLKTIVLPDGLQDVLGGAFYHCESLTTLRLPGSLQTIGGGAFSWCKSLKAVALPENLQTIESATFEYCESLTTITLPLGLKRIEYSAFNRCKALNYIEIPWTVEEIHNSAFGHNNTCLTLCDASGSLVEEYARKNNLRFQTYDGRWFAPVTKREPTITTNDIHVGNSAGGCGCVGCAVYFLITVALIAAFSVVWEICLALI